MIMLRLFAVLMILIITACDLKSPQKIEEKPCAVVFDIDRSGSYDLTKDALRRASTLINSSARACDIWFFRWIDDASYTPKAAIFTLQLPCVKAPSNLLDPKARDKYRKGQYMIAQLKKKAVSKLLSLKPERAPYTDVFGAVCKASEILNNNYKNYRKFLILTTDLRDNLNRKCNASLKDVTIIIFLFEADKDPLRTQQRIKRWRRYFVQNGAKEVILVTPSEPLSLVEEIMSQK